MVVGGTTEPGAVVVVVDGTTAAELLVEVSVGLGAVVVDVDVGSGSVVVVMVPDGGLDDVLLEVDVDVDVELVDELLVDVDGGAPPVAEDVHRAGLRQPRADHDNVAVIAIAVPTGRRPGVSATSMSRRCPSASRTWTTPP